MLFRKGNYKIHTMFTILTKNFNNDELLYWYRGIIKISLIEAVALPSGLCIGNAIRFAKEGSGVIYE